MKKIAKWGGLFVLGVIIFGLISSYAPDTDKEAMIAKYGGEQASFVQMAGGANIHYRDQGPKDAPAIILIHGMSAHLQVWEPLIAQIGEPYRIVSLDLPGFGLTGPNPTGEYGPQAYIEAIISVMDAAHIDKAVIAGNSMGGLTAWRMGLSHPERINGLVLLDPSGAPSVGGGAGNEAGNLAFTLMNSSIGKALMPHFTPRAIVKQSILQSVERDDIVTDEMVDRYYELTRYPGNRHASLEAIKWSDDSSAWPQISALDMPVLILWGREDQLLDVSRAEQFARELDGEKVIIYDNVGHMPMEEVPAIVARDIKQWWASDVLGAISP